MAFQVNTMLAQGAKSVGGAYQIVCDICEPATKLVQQTEAVDDDRHYEVKAEEEDG